MTTFSVLCYLGLYAVILYLCWFLQKKLECWSSQMVKEIAKSNFFADE